MACTGAIHIYLIASLCLMLQERLDSYIYILPLVYHHDALSGG